MPRSQLLVSKLLFNSHSSLRVPIITLFGLPPSQVGSQLFVFWLDSFPLVTDVQEPSYPFLQVPERH